MGFLVGRKSLKNTSVQISLLHITEIANIRTASPKSKQMEKLQTTSRSSSEERYITDEERLLKHESHQEGFKGRNRRSCCPSMPTVHILLISVYTLIFFFLSYNSLQIKTPRINLVPCEYQSPRQRIRRQTMKVLR